MSTVVEIFPDSETLVEAGGRRLADAIYFAALEGIDKVQYV